MCECCENKLVNDARATCSLSSDSHWTNDVIEIVYTLIFYILIQMCNNAAFCADYIRNCKLCGSRKTASKGLARDWQTSKTHCFVRYICNSDCWY